MYAVDRALTLLRDKVPAQNSIITIFGISAITLFIGVDKMEGIVQDIDPHRHNADYLYDYIYREISERNMFFDNVIEYFFANIRMQNLEIRDLLELISILIEDGEEGLLDVIIGEKNIDELLITRGYKNSAISDISWINKLVIEILKLHGGNTLFCADCGMGSFLMMAHNESIAQNIIGHTFNIANFAFASARAYFIDKRNIKVQQGEIFCEPLTQKADMIYAAYPFMLKYRTEELEIMFSKWRKFSNVRIGKRYSSNMLCVINMLESLSENGILVTLIPDGGLVNGIDTEIREFIIQNNYLDTLISLPVGIIPLLNVKTSILILKNDRTSTDDITMIDASETYQKQRRFSVLTENNINEIVRSYMHGRNCKGFPVSKDKVIENNYYLGIERYKQTENALINPCTLDGISKKIFRGYQIKASELDEMVTEDTDSTEYRVINVSDIQPEGFISESLKAITVNNLKKLDKYCLEDGDIIITAKNTTIKTAVYKQRDNEKVILTGNLIAVRVNKRKINPYYLKTFFDSESGKASMKSIQTGTTLISINPSSLKEMKISLLPMDYQEKLAEMFVDRLNEIEKLLNRYVELSAELTGLYDNFARIDFR